MRSRNKGWSYKRFCLHLRFATRFPMIQNSLILSSRLTRLAAFGRLTWWAVSVYCLLNIDGFPIRSLTFKSLASASGTVIPLWHLFSYALGASLEGCWSWHCCKTALWLHLLGISWLATHCAPFAGAAQTHNVQPAKIRSYKPMQAAVAFSATLSKLSDECRNLMIFRFHACFLASLSYVIIVQYKSAKSANLDERGNSPAESNHPEWRAGWLQVWILPTQQ